MKPSKIKLKITPEDNYLADKELYLEKTFGIVELRPKDSNRD